MTKEKAPEERLVPVSEEELKSKLLFKTKGGKKGSMIVSVQRPVRGLSVYKMHVDTGEVTLAKVDKKGFNTKAKNVGTITVNEKYLYVQALNLKNAIKKFTPR